MTSAFLAQFDPLRRLAERAMTDTCEILIDTGGVDDDTLDPDTGELTPTTPDVLWTGPCRIAFLSTAGDAPQAGRQVGESNYEASVPLDCPPPPRGAVLHVLTVDERSDQGLAGRQFRIRRVPLETVVVSRTLQLADYEGDDG